MALDVEQPPVASTAAPETPAPSASAPGRVGSEQQNAAASSSSKAAASSAGSLYHFQADVPCPYCLPGSKYPHGRTGLHWHEHWRSADLREALTIPALAAATIALTFVPTAKSPSWQAPLLLDSPARKLLRLHDASARKTAHSVSDVLLYWGIAHAALIDPLLVATWRRAPGVAWQISIINAQAYALTLLLNQATKRLTSRERPYVDVCDRDPTGQSCSSGSRYASFYSGHAAMTATGAGLLCAHHTQLQIYGNDTLDTGTCVAAVLGTALTGAMRIASDNHWASDVFVGHLMGYASGYLLPTLLYYKELRPEPESGPARGGSTVAALPMFDGNAFGLSLSGVF